MNRSTEIKDYLNSLPFAALVAKDDKSTLNHQVVHLNNKFLTEIGYTLEEIPDKNSWWLTAYPDPAYQKVVARHWELAVETYNESEGKHVVMDAEIRTKDGGPKMFRVYSEAEKYQFPGFYIVMFEPID